MSINDKQSLITHIGAGNRVKYLFFWGHTPQTESVVDKSCFSQWYAASFEIDNIRYQTAEHYMMAEKARMFQDNDRVDQILATEHPHEAKNLGRSVSGFDNNSWRDRRMDIVITANQAKFAQNTALGEFLINTGDSILVEASPHDTIWGIGLDKNSPYANNPAAWRGLNLLGFALMQVRSLI